MQVRGQEVAKKLIARQRAKVIEAETRVAEERRKLQLIESLGRDLAVAIEEVVGTSKGPDEDMSPEPEMLDLGRPKPQETGSKRKKESMLGLKLAAHEVLDYVDRFGLGKPFTPLELKEFIEQQESIQIALVPLQWTLARMAKGRKGIMKLTPKACWTKSTYRSSALALSESINALS